MEILARRVSERPRVVILLEWTRHIQGVIVELHHGYQFQGSGLIFHIFILEPVVAIPA